MSDAKLVNIARLMTTYNLEIEQLPDNLKCAQCKLVLKDACQVPCGCRFCRTCVYNMMVRGNEFCPGVSEECGDSPLSRFTTDYLANNGVLRSIVKCPHDGCVHECRVANMAEHLRLCPRRTEECMQNKLTAEEMGGHLVHENCKDSETLKQRDEASNREIDMLKQELVIKNEQIGTIMDQMKLVDYENKSIKEEIKSIQEENQDLANRVRVLSDELQKIINKKRENDEVESAGLIEHVDEEIVRVSGLVGSDSGTSSIFMKSVHENFGSIDQSVKSVRDDNSAMTSQIRSIQIVERLQQIDASCEWLIDTVLRRCRWSWGDKRSEYFPGAVRPYKFQLGSANYDGADGAALYIYLYIHVGPSDRRLVWPFDATVTVTVTDMDRHDVRQSISRQCQIVKPLDRSWRRSDDFVFLHSELIDAGLNLDGGVRVSCVVYLGE